MDAVPDASHHCCVMGEAATETGVRSDPHTTLTGRPEEQNEATAISGSQYGTITSHPDRKTAYEKSHMAPTTILRNEEHQNRIITFDMPVRLFDGKTVRHT